MPTVPAWCWSWSQARGSRGSPANSASTRTSGTATTLRRPADCQPGAEAIVSVKAVYKLPDGSEGVRRCGYLCLHRPVRAAHGHPYARARGANGRSGGTAIAEGVGWTVRDRLTDCWRLSRRVPVGDTSGYSPAWMTTRPPSRTWMFRSCPSRSNMPTRGVLPITSASMSRS